MRGWKRMPGQIRCSCVFFRRSCANQQVCTYEVCVLRNAAVQCSDFSPSRNTVFSPHRSDALLLPASPDLDWQHSSSQLSVSIKSPAHLLPRRVFAFQAFRKSRIVLGNDMFRQGRTSARFFVLVQTNLTYRCLHLRCFAIDICLTTRASASFRRKRRSFLQIREHPR